MTKKLDQKQRLGSSPIPYILVTLALLTAGYFWFNRAEIFQLSKPIASPGAPFPLPAIVPAGTKIRIDGSTSMVTINKNLKTDFEQTFRYTTVETQSNGSNQGVRALLAGQIDLAAISRPLTAEEEKQGLRSVPIATDPIAIVVGSNNPFRDGLTAEQVKGIFQGAIDNWSAVGGPSVPLRVINRPAVSGTHQALRELALNGGNFGSTPNITTLSVDATTPLLRELGNDGIGYATYAQVANQQTVRPVPIDGHAPNTPDYPYQRSLFYAYREPASPEVQAFLGFAASPAGQQAIVSSESGN